MQYNSAMLNTESPVIFVPGKNYDRRPGRVRLSVESRINAIAATSLRLDQRGGDIVAVGGFNSRSGIGSEAGLSRKSILRVGNLGANMGLEGRPPKIDPKSVVAIETGKVLEEDLDASRETLLEYPNRILVTNWFYKGRVEKEARKRGIVFDRVYSSDDILERRGRLAAKVMRKYHRSPRHLKEVALEAIIRAARTNRLGSTIIDRLLVGKLRNPGNT